MMIAVTHIGGQWRPGDILPDGLPRETVEWLLAAGAIRMEGTPPPAAEAEEPERQEEFDDTAEAEEIDVMDGIVEEKPKAARKKGGTRR